MLNDRLVFALCTARIHSLAILESVKQFVNEAHRRNYAVLVFNAGFDHEPSHLQEHSCYSVFDLIPLQIVDAIVVMNDAIDNHIVVDTIAAIAKEHRIPVLSYDGKAENIPSLYSYPNHAFEMLLDHIFGDHQCKRVNLLTGVHGDYSSEHSVMAYSEALRKYNIPFEAKRIGYGCYTENITREVTERFLLHDAPDAIVCVTDEMAITVCSVLRSHGLRVPEDVIVTGLGGIDMRDIHVPRLTTCAKDYERLCAAFFDSAEMIFDGETTKLDMEIKPLVHISESCGCRVTELRDQNPAIWDLHTKLKSNMKLEAQDRWLLSDMTERIQPSVIDYLDVISSCIPEDSYLCLRDSLGADLTENSLQHFADSSELMSTVMHKHKEKQFRIVPRASLIPSLEQILDSGNVVLFNAIYMLTDIYGYYAYYGNDLRKACFQLPKLIHTAGNVIGYCLAAAKIQNLHKRLDAARVRDSLTGMLNLRGANNVLLESLRTEKHENDQLVIIVIGLNQLRRINSVYGRTEGDLALLNLSDAITDCIDNSVTAARIGGDEFMLAFFQTANQVNMAEVLISVLQKRMASYNQISGKNYSIDISVGCVSANVSSSLSIDGLLKQAIALKDSQHSPGKEITKKEVTKKVIPDDEQTAQMKRVLDENLLYYHFQPIVNAKNGQIYAYEALMRTSGGIKISPLMLLNYATQADRLYEIEWYTHNNVLRYVSEHREIFSQKRIFINSIPGHFLDETDFLKLREMYSELLPQLVVEFTEQAETEGDELSMIQARCARNHMAIAVDDYGTGYSNISNLLRYSPNYVKIDRSLISSIHEEPKKQHFVTNIIEFAHANGFMALAEGVETIEELRTIIRFGIDLIQGNFTSRPVENPISSIPEHIEAMIQKFSASAEKQIIQKTYVLDTDETQIYLSKLDEEHYTELFITQPYLEIIGDFHETSNVHIKIKDDTDCHIILRDVHFNLPQQLVSSVITLGKKSNVTIEFQGDNRMDNGGILVPESSSLHLIGNGNLSIRADNTKAFAIGNDPDLACGDINIELAGILSILSNAVQCVGIGSGFGKGQCITVTGTRMFFEMTGKSGVGIGAHEGNITINVSGCEADFSMRMASSVAIGCMEGMPNISCDTVSSTVIGSGTFVCGIGSETGGGKITLRDSTVIQEFTGQTAIGIGSGDSAPSVSLRQCKASIHMEGNHAMDLGSFTEDASLMLLDSDFNIAIQSAKVQHLAANPDYLIQTGSTYEISINK